MRYESYNIQPGWQHINNADPDYLFLLGDHIYMDWTGNLGEPENYTFVKFKAEMKIKYENQWNEPHFKALIEKMRNKNGLFGTWDDHDFAWNNAKGAEMISNREKLKKEFSRATFHEYFYNCSTNLPELYYAIDTPHARVIFLDNRYYAERSGKNRKLLGTKQFSYLHEKLSHNLKYTIICGGLTLTEMTENWQDYPNELQYLSEMLAEKERVLFLAGDIHKNVFVKPKKLKNGVKTPPQIISSGKAIKLFGERHNWAMLDFTGGELSVKFYKSNSIQEPLTQECNNWLKSNGY
jgi:phosphodiesterase/alkaline phosphatase D-like protein